MTFQIAKLFTQEKMIDVGIDIYSQNKHSIFERHLGDNWLISAMTGYGKTLMVRNLLTELEDRQIIGFDSRKEHKNLSRINFKNKEGRGNAITDLLYIDEFGFKIEDFQNEFDWEQMGLQVSGARICAEAAKKTYRHKNNLDKFLEIISEIPTKGKNSEFFMTLMSLKSKLKNLRGNFVDNNAIDITDKNPDKIRYTGNPFYISDWKHFIRKHKHICINFNSENNPMKAQLFAGKILNEIKTALTPKNPSVIFMEESHFLYPAYFDSENIPYSSNMIYQYAKTKHKDAVKLIYITQYPHQIAESALDEIKWFFIGKLENVKGYGKIDEMLKQSSKLEYNPQSDYREWICYSPSYNTKFIFKGFDSATRYEKRK